MVSDVRIRALFWVNEDGIRRLLNTRIPSILLVLQPSVLYAKYLSTVCTWWFMLYQIHWSFTRTCNLKEWIRLKENLTFCTKPLTWSISQICWHLYRPRNAESSILKYSRYWTFHFFVLNSKTCLFSILPEKKSQIFSVVSDFCTQWYSTF